MEPGGWEEFVEVLKHLGCRNFRESDFDITLIRGSMKFAAIRKLSPVPRVIRQDVLRKLEFQDLEYAAALHEVRCRP
jgi:hypothetical protein